MSNTTINGIVIHNGSSAVITDNHCDKETFLIEMPLYGQDSDSTDVFDFGGVVKNIRLTGVYIGANVAALKTWIDSLEALQNGHQDKDAGAPYTFVDDLRGNLKVKVRSFSTSYISAETTKIGWTLNIVQSSENS